MLCAPQHTHNCHAVVEQRLSKHHNEEDLIDVDLLKHGDDSYGVHSSNQTAEQEILQQANIQVTCNAQGRRWIQSDLWSIQNRSNSFIGRLGLGLGLGQYILHMLLKRYLQFMFFLCFIIFNFTSRHWLVIEVT